MTKLTKRMVSQVENLLLARRNRNVKREQHEYEKLRLMCERYGLDETNVINEGTKWLKQHKTSPLGAW
jgi:hypothetical protein